MPTISMKEVESVLTELQEAIAVNQCAEDSAKEDHIKKTLGVVNGTLLNVVGELKYMIERLEEVK